MILQIIYWMLSTLLLNPFPGDAMMTSKVPTAGYFPKSFPRDPVDVNIYLEHILIGQILEPLFLTALDGTTIPGVAESWEVSRDRLRINVSIRPGLRFSNGVEITADDVRYSILRHLETNRSQSREYLAAIKDAEVLSPLKIAFHLSRPCVAFFKILSRDHFGIVPNHWSFDKGASEPYVASGPYRAVRENGSWFLLRNSFYREAEKTGIGKWRIVQSDLKEIDSEVPDYIPFGVTAQLERIKLTPAFVEKNLKEEKINHFFQVSSWWYRREHKDNSPARKALGMLVMRDFLEIVAKERGLRPATGLIPMGIQGYLPERPGVNPPLEAMRKVANRRFLVVALAREYFLLNNPVLIAKIEHRFKVKLEIVSVDAVNLSKIRALDPDILTVGFAGGFYDPEGFIGIVASLLGLSLEDVLSDVLADYKIASDEENWSQRSKLFQSFGRKLQESYLMVPGWKFDVSRYYDKGLTPGTNNLSYTPKLSIVHLRKEVE